MRYKCIISYDGYNYKGFQVQPGEVTIEICLKEAIKMMLHKDVKIYPAGRTDAMVHAFGQVIHFDLDLNIKPEAIKNGLNSFLPRDIRIVDASIVDDNFHARFSAKKKEYHYLVKQTEPSVFENRYMAYYKNLDLELMIEALRMLCGKHNFKGFCSGSVNPLKDFEKIIYEAKIIKDGDYLRFIFVGNGFLKYQIRRMMGLVLEIGAKRDSLETITRVFNERDPGISHKIAPGYGLYLMKVYYD